MEILMKKGNRNELDKKLNKLVDAFSEILYEDDVRFMNNMRKKKKISEEELRKYAHWEWTQGVGLYGIWKLFTVTDKQEYLDMLTKYYDNQLQVGFPPLNVNTAAPYLTMSFVGEYLKSEAYMGPCRVAAEGIMQRLPRTREAGIQHKTSDDDNTEELWDDTLFVAILFLANMGKILQKAEYVEEAQYQFLLHMKYLQEPRSGFWYHGWTFLQKNNFAEAFWGRGNCWITIAIPEFLEMGICSESVARILAEALQNQVEALETCQAESGMWHTLLDDPDSYEEASATCGFAYGILRSVHSGLLEEKWSKLAEKALHPILSFISEDGVLEQVSYGTPMGRQTKEFYKNIPLQPMPYGQALAILFLTEIRQLSKEIFNVEDRIHLKTCRRQNEENKYTALKSKTKRQIEKLS